VLTANAPETKDNDFTWKDFQAKNNNELVAILGNFVNRVIVLIHKYFDGKVPQHNGLENLEIEFTDYKEKVTSKLENYQFRDAQFEMMSLARFGNKYLADKEPWKLIKENEKAVEDILFNSLQIIGNLIILMRPFLPKTSDKIVKILNLPKQILSWETAGNEVIIASGHEINKGELLFSKIEDQEVEIQKQKLLNSKKANMQKETGKPPIKDEIEFDDFMKLDIRIIKILEAERIPKTDKLLKLKIDLGFEQRTIVSGIAHIYKPEDVIGKQATYLANLKPRKIRGVESTGMILMIQENEGKLNFLNPDKEAELGSPVG
jgi:methionyl-tRNA synthetase